MKLTHQDATLITKAGKTVTGAIFDNSLFVAGKIDWKGRFKPVPFEAFECEVKNIEPMDDGFGPIGYKAEQA